MIKTKIVVSQYADWSGHQLQNKEFSRVLATWYESELAQYLYAHGKPTRVHAEKDYAKQQLCYILEWDLAEEDKTYALLKWSNDPSMIFLQGS